MTTATTRQQFREVLAGLAAKTLTRMPSLNGRTEKACKLVLQGDVTLVLDQDEVRLKPFDVVVQRGTNHAWRNNGNEPALLAAVLIDALPV